ncbi:hypothetical protein LIER_35451 [Lithospermum erythrorhizon]|uniref:Uncharacterized protein n=1 Tax=Lithospermum erythrorhizon TaxID=34254 RepID=A0AAV3NS13_LITER
MVVNENCVIKESASSNRIPYQNIKTNVAIEENDKRLLILRPITVQLITGTDTRCKEFQNMIRTYNNHFAFTSIGISCDETLQKRDHGIYTVKVQGQVHHYLDDLMPQESSKKLSGI